MSQKNQLSLLISATLGLGGLLAIPVFAQDSTLETDEDLLLEEVIVTGTRIKSVDGFGRTSPVTVVDMQEIESFGYTRVEEFLNTLPQIEYANTSFDSNGAEGAANLDLRGLGPERNLVLINGRRVQPGGVYQYAPDINQIPAQMIERVEVLTGGASATYGADAVAGVVNFIMRRVDGVEARIGMNGYQHDNRNGYIQGLMDEQGFDYPKGGSGIDGKSYNASIVIGGDFGDGRGNATAYATWRSNNALLWGQRDYSSCALNSMGTACGGSSQATEIPNFWISPLTEDGWGPSGYDFFQEEFLVLQPDSSLLVDDWRNPSNLYNYAPINFYMRPDERWSLGAFVNYEINPHAVAYLESMFTSDGTNSQIAETGTFWYFSPLPISNAYFPENFRKSLEELWPGADEFGIYIGKRNVEGGPRKDQLRHNSFRIVTGVRGTLTDEWEYDISYLYGQTGSSSTYVNDFLAPRIGIAVDSRLCEADRSCIPYQVFTYQGVTKEAADSLSGTGTAIAKTSTTVIQAYVTGTTPWGLPAGDIMTAAGFEHREVDFERTADTIYKEGQLMGWGGWSLDDLSGGYSVNEVFIEANVPLLANLSLVRNMTLDLAYRWSDYSTSGPSSTYRAGLDWQVLEWLRFRTGYNRAVRAPNIAELFEPQQPGGYAGGDPCEGTEPIYSFEQCARTGVTAQQYGQIDAPPFEYDWWHNAIYGGNPNLGPEKADTLTAGLVFEIGEAMQFSLDYWDIRIKNAIEEMDPAIALDQCALNGNLCDLIHRAPGSGSLWRSRDGYIYGIAWNLGELHYRGIDVAWNWSPGDNWQMDLIGTWYLKKQTTVIPNDPSTALDCVGLVRTPGFDDPGGCIATPKWRHTATLTYDSNSFWSLTGRWRFFSKITYDGDVDQIAADNLDAQNYLDVSAVFRFMETHDLTLGVNNILDREPPLVGPTLRSNANSINMYDLLGRFLFANLTLRW